MASVATMLACFLGSCASLAVGWALGYREGWLAGTAEPPLPATDDAEVARMFGIVPREREDGPWKGPIGPHAK